MVLWQRLGLTVIAMLVASFIVGLLWRYLFNMPIPSYLAGIIGGITAIPVWELLKKIKKKEKSDVQIP